MKKTTVKLADGQPAKPQHTSKGLRISAAKIKPRQERGCPRKTAISAAPSEISQDVAPSAHPYSQDGVLEVAPLSQISEPQSWEFDPEIEEQVESLQNDQQKVEVDEDLRVALEKYLNSQRATKATLTSAQMAKFMRIRVPYPRQIVAMGEIDELRRLGQEMRGEQQLALSIFEPTHCGKSTLAHQYKLMINGTAPIGTVPVMYLRVSASVSAIDMYASIIAQSGDGFPTSGNENSLRRRALNTLEELRTELVLLDESQHGNKTCGFNKDIMSEIKIMLDTGLVPFVLLGTDAAVPMFERDPELSGRMFSPCSLGPLAMSDQEDFDLWCGFLAAVEAKMITKEIVSGPLDLASEDIAEALGVVTKGVIGHAMRVILMALRNSIRRGAETITIDDLATAVDEWAIKLGFADDNPFSRM